MFVEIISSLKLRQAYSRKFWDLKAFQRRCEFKLAKLLFKGRREFTETLSNQKALNSIIFRNTLWVIITAVLATAILLVEWHIPIIPSLPDESESQYSTITIGISGIGGVFIGLYYSGLTAAAGAVYSNVPSQVRDLLVRERIGSTYMKFLAFYTSLSLAFSLAYLLLGLTSFLGALILVFLSIIAVFGFVDLGRQAFNFFNPATLSVSSLQRLIAIPDDVIHGGFLSNNPSFQNHANERAREELSVIESIARICAEADSLRGKPLALLCQNLARVFFRYRHRKSKIPLDSKWFEHKVVHPDWYREGGSAVGIALSTGTLPQPKEIPDLHWFEYRIWKILKSSLRYCLIKGEYKQASVLINSITSILSNLAKTHDLTIALNLTDGLVSLCVDHITDNKTNSLRLPPDESLEYLQFISALSSLPTQLLIGFSKSVSDLDEKALDKVSKSSSSIGNLEHDKALPLEVYRALNDLNEKLVLERKIWGHVISAPWYIAEILRLELLRFYKPHIEVNLALCWSSLSKLIEIAKANDDSWALAIFYSSRIEFLNKFDYHWEIIKSSINSISENRKISDLDWPTIEFSTPVNVFKSENLSLSKDLALHCQTLLTMKRPSNFPDFAGQFMAHTSETLLDALIKDDQELFILLLVFQITACLNKFQQLNSLNQGTNLVHLEPKLRNASAPLLDLIELMGLAILIAEFREDQQLMTEIEGSWDALVTTSGMPTFNQMVILIYNIATNRMMLEPRSDVKFQWRRRVETLLEEGPYKVMDGDAFGGRYRVPDHSSDLVSSMMPHQRYGFSGIYGGAILIHRHLRKTVSKNDASEGTKERMVRNAVERVARQRAQDVY